MKLAETIISKCARLNEEDANVGGFKMNDPVMFNDGHEFAGMVGAIVNLRSEENTVDVLLGKSLRIQINPSDIHAVNADINNVEEPAEKPEVEVEPTSAE